MSHPHGPSGLTDGYIHSRVFSYLSRSSCIATRREDEQNFMLSFLVAAYAPPRMRTSSCVLRHVRVQKTRRLYSFRSRFRPEREPWGRLIGIYWSIGATRRTTTISQADDIQIHWLAGLMDYSLLHCAPVKSTTKFTAEIP
jgi:hypothetical protein